MCIMYQCRPFQLPYSWTRFTSTFCRQVTRRTSTGQAVVRAANLEKSIPPIPSRLGTAFHPTMQPGDHDGRRKPILLFFPKGNYRCKQEKMGGIVRYEGIHIYM